MLRASPTPAAHLVGWGITAAVKLKPHSTNVFHRAQPTNQSHRNSQIPTHHTASTAIIRGWRGGHSSSAFLVADPASDSRGYAAPTHCSESAMCGSLIRSVPAHSSSILGRMTWAAILIRASTPTQEGFVRSRALRHPSVVRDVASTSAAVKILPAPTPRKARLRAVTIPQPSRTAPSLLQPPRLATGRSSDARLRAGALPAGVNRARRTLLAENEHCGGYLVDVGCVLLLGGKV